MTSKTTLHEALKKHFGFSNFKGQQAEIIRSLMNGHDVFVLMPTGGGKSLCYQLPALMMEGTAIVVSPLIALMKNQVDAMRTFSEEDGVAHFLNSSLNKASVEKVKADVYSGKTKLLYIAPESLTKADNVGFLKTCNISFYAIDEAHCISEWGHDFRPEYRRLRALINEVGSGPVIALTATATPKVQHDIQKNLAMNKALVFKSSFNRPNLYYEVRPKTKDIDRDVIRFIRNNKGKSGIIYCLSRKKVEELTATLQVNDIAALPYHAGMDANSRAVNQDAFLHEKVDVIVATIAFGMGIDKPDVRYVIHYDIPKSLEGYYQETGRAGRDGGEGQCIAFYTSRDLQKLEKLMSSKPAPEQEICRQLLMETANYAESAMCRRKMLLHYFGETYEHENCGNCDNCLNPKVKVEAKEELCAVIEAVIGLKEKVRAEYLLSILTGRRTDQIRAHGHDSLEAFGSVPKIDEKFLGAVIRQGALAGYLVRDIGSYGLIDVTKKGKDFLKNPVSFKVVEDAEFNDSEADPAFKGGSGGAADPELFAILKDLRKKVARIKNLPPYVIFQDPSLEAMATTYPITVEELAGIPGVGAGKAKRYGNEFVEVIKRHVETNDIERPEDLRVRTVPQRSNTKIFIIQGIDRKINLEELAESKGLEFSEFLDELEAIVEGGTRINIDYYMQEILDEEHEEELMDYFHQCQEDDIEAAIQELGEEYTEDEIRLARVKFLSEMGN